jgi:catechol 2,3-dioxygenase-like lactoylglutathione lyase family enzyme
VDVFGARIAQEFGDAMVILELPGLDAQFGISREDDLAEGSAERRSGLEHFGIATDDLDALLAKGIELLEPVEERDPDRMEAAMGEPVKRIAYVRAPDNVRIELIEMRT